MLVTDCEDVWWHKPLIVLLVFKLCACLHHFADVLFRSMMKFVCSFCWRCLLDDVASQQVPCCTGVQSGAIRDGQYLSLECLKNCENSEKNILWNKNKMCMSPAMGPVHIRHSSHEIATNVVVENWILNTKTHVTYTSPVFSHSIQNYIEAILACSPALSTKWLG